MRTGSARWGIPGRATLIVLLAALFFIAGAVYKWVDDQGNVHYSDQPPPGRESKVVPLAPGPTAEQKAQAEQRLKAIRESAQREAAAREAEQAHEIQQQATQQSQTAAAALAVQVCADARVQRMTLDLQVPVYRRGPGGERIFIPDADRHAAKKNLDETIATYCSDDPTAAAAQRQRFLELSLGRRPACIELRDALHDLEARPPRDSAEQVERLTERLRTFNCTPVPVEQVWLSQEDYQLRAPPDE
jgi:Domain of unknown function (DUF4124)